MKKFFLFFLLFSQTSALTVPTLTIYTYSSFASEFGIGPKIKSIFEKKNQCRIKFVTTGDSVTLLNRLYFEGKNTKADIVLGLDSSLIKLAKSTHLFTEHLVQKDESTSLKNWKDNIFLPYDYNFITFIYNKKKISCIPKTLHEFINSLQFSSCKIVYSDPRTSIPGLGFLLWIQKIYGEKSIEIWKKLSKKTITITKNWSESYALFLRGEADMVLSYITSPSYHSIMEKIDDYESIIFEEGLYKQTEVAGRLITSKNPKLSAKFMEFLISKDFQELIPTNNWMYPIINVATPPEFKVVPNKKILSISYEEMSKNKIRWINNWKNTVITP